MEELERQGKKIPEDVTVTGYDNSLYARQGQGITTITHPQEKLGEMAAKLLLEKLGGVPDEESTVERLIRPELIIRGSSVKTGRDYKFWFCTGSQDLYGDECLRKVAEHSKIIVEELNKSGVLPFEVVWKPTLITNELIRKTFNDANADKKVQERLASWMRTAVGIMESSHIRVCRVADNMRNVAVTEGDKVEVQMKFGWEIDAYPVNEITEYVQDVSQGDIDVLVEEYYNKYDMILDGRDPEEFKKHVAVQAGIEIGFERFLEEKKYQAIVTHFGDLGSLEQLPGLAIQRLMEKGYGFGGEGDWKTAAMGIEAVYIDGDTTIRNLQNELRWNSMYFSK